MNEVRRHSPYFSLLAGPLPGLLALAIAGAGLWPRAAAALSPQRPVAGAPEKRGMAGAVIHPAQVRAVYAQLPLAFVALPGSPDGGERAGARRGSEFGAAGSRFGLRLGPTGATLALPAAPAPALKLSHRQTDASSTNLCLETTRAHFGVRTQLRWVPGAAALEPPSLGCQVIERVQAVCQMDPALVSASSRLESGSALPHSKAVVQLHWQGANPHARAVALEKLPGQRRCYIGRDPRRWDNGSALYAKVKYESVYPGIDLLYYGNQRQLEYDWRVAPGADPGRIRLVVQGMSAAGSRVSLDRRGELRIETPGGTICQPKPRLYQERAGQRVAIAGGYVLEGSVIGFRVGRYDRRRPLVIDPTLVYSTFVGGPGADEGNSIAVDAAGHVYLTGLAAPPTLWPTTPSALPSRASAALFGAFVTKLDLTKSGAAALVYSTYLGAEDVGEGIALDPAGNVYVTGSTFDATLPVTPGAFQPSFGLGDKDAFVAKLSPSGALVYATYLGGSVTQEANAVAVDPAGNAYVAGDTESPDFPITVNAFQPRLPNFDFPHAFVTKLDPTGKPVYSTYLGGSREEFGNGIAADAAGNASVIGSTYSRDFPTTSNAIQKQPPPDFQGNIYSDAFVVRLSPAGALLFSTLLGGVRTGDTVGQGIAVDAAQNIYVTGATESATFPVTPGAFQLFNRGDGDPNNPNANAFVTRISAAGALVYSTFLGGSDGDQGTALTVDAVGDAFVTGQTRSPDFPATASGVQTRIGLGPDGKPTSDAFVVILEPGGTFLYFSTFLGGSGADTASAIARDGSGNVYVAGTTDSPNFPTTPGAFQPAFGGDQNKDANIIQGDAFVAKISLR